MCDKNLKYPCHQHYIKQLSDTQCYKSFLLILSNKKSVLFKYDVLSLFWMIIINTMQRFIFR